MKLSVIIPCHNEEDNIIAMHDVLTKALKNISYELIFIDDGSTDNTLKNLKYIYSDDLKHVKVISFSRNFKKEAAIYAGIKKAVGDYTCIIDGDLQQNPKYIIDMFNFLEENENYDQVAMVIKKRTENIVFSFLKRVWYKLIDKISDIKFVNGASDFRMFKLNVKSSLIELGENNRFSKGLFSWVGFNTKYLPYSVEKRKNGKTKFGFKNSVNYAMDGIIGFSTKPLRIATYMGVFTSIIAFIYTAWIIIKTLIFGVDVAGYASLICVILFLGGTQLLTIGILSEYLAKTYLEAKKRPIYITKEEIGFETKK